MTRVPGSVILNSLLQHVSGVPWERVQEPAAARTRLRRGARKGEFSAVHEFVITRTKVFTGERRVQFEAVAALERDIRRRVVS